MADYVPSPKVAKIAAALHATPLAERLREDGVLVIVFNELGKQLYTKDDIARLLSEAPIVNSEHPVQKDIKPSQDEAPETVHSTRRKHHAET